MRSLATFLVLPRVSPPRHRWLLIAVALCASAAPARAQDASHWGVHLSFVPTWSIPTTIAPIFGDDVRVDGNDLRVGVTRGRMLSGDWSLNYVRKRVADGSLVALDDSVRISKGVMFDGVAADKFVPFGTIKRRVQLGLILGGGIGWGKGEVIAQNEDGLRTQLKPEALLAPLDFELSFTPLARVEFGVAVLTIRNLKVRGSYGFNYPGLARATFGAVYLFGND